MTFSFSRRAAGVTVLTQPDTAPRAMSPEQPASQWSVARAACIAGRV